MLAEGDRAPDFTLPDQDGEPLSLSDLAGQLTVVYFYPRANSSGCTTQACGIRDRSSGYAAAGAQVVGISPDPVPEVRKFHGRQGLDFKLLADEDHAVCEAFGVWAEKSMYGRKYWGAQRATFILDAEGRVMRVFRKVSPKTHDDVVLKALDELQPA